MRRLWMVLEYDGSGFHGWQLQENQITLQGTIEHWIKRLWHEKVRLVVAGRTDAGVHASGQVVHFDMEREVEPFGMMMGLNHYLKQKKCAIIAMGVAPRDFHARFDACYRAYEYRLLQRKAPSVLNGGLLWHYPKELNLQNMRMAAKQLQGFHDFSSFRGAGCQAKCAEKHLDICDIFQLGAELRFRFVSRSFLYHQVRIMVGTLVEIGKGKRNVAWIDEVLQQKDRVFAGPTAPARGLMLHCVAYDERIHPDSLFSVDKPLLPF